MKQTSLMMSILVVLGLFTHVNAQLLNKPKALAADPLFKGFTTKGTTLTRGNTKVTFDVAGGRVVGLFVQGSNVQDIARGLVAAWGGKEKNIAGLAASLNNDKMRSQARSSQGFEQDGNGTVLRIKLTGTGNVERWSAYTSLLAYPDSAFPASANVQGSPKASYVLRIFSEFQCPYCKEMWDSAHSSWATQPNVYRVVYYHFPLGIHKNSEPGAIASECAAAQGQFWAYADKLFNTVEDWAPQPDPKAKFVKYAHALKLNANTFQKCLRSSKSRTTVHAQYATGLKLGVRGTPSVYLNGVQMRNYGDSEEMALIRMVMAASPNAVQVIEARLKRF